VEKSMSKLSVEGDLPQSARSRSWVSDLLSSVVVFFVALPLCMGVALASGAPVAAGLITGIVGGIVAGSLAGCPLQVSGPAAGLTVIVFEIVQRFGLQMLGLAVLAAGVLQIAAGTMRLGQWFRAVSPAVIKGMLAGIGVIIFASQFHVMIDDKPRPSPLENLATIPSAVWKSLNLPQIHGRAERAFRAEGLQTVAELSHRQIRLRREVAEIVPYHDEAHAAPELEKVVSPELKGLAAKQASLTTELAELDDHLAEVRESASGAMHLDHAHAAVKQAEECSRRAEAALRSGLAVKACYTQQAAVAALDSVSARLKNHRLAATIGVLTIAIILLWQRLAPRALRLVPAPLVAVGAATGLAAWLLLPVLYVEIPGSLVDEIRLPTWAVVQSAPWVDVIKLAFVIAIVASAETLLCAAAVDQMQAGARTNYDRELVAQGVGNMCCGVLGALPMTGVIVRSSANIQAGARSRLSSILHGVWLLAFVVLLSGLLRMIPTASLAAVLVVTGYKLIDFKSVKQLWRYGWGEVGIYAATLTTIVATDLLTGVVVGIGLAAAKLLYTFAHLTVEVEASHDGNRYAMRLVGAATFIRLPLLAAALEKIPENTELHVELDRLSYIDHACLELLTTWAEQHEAAGGQLVVDWETLHAVFHHHGAHSAACPAAA
jgi:MFS superfamily sulfate permease-like transporter